MIIKRERGSEISWKAGVLQREAGLRSLASLLPPCGTRFITSWLRFSTCNVGDRPALIKSGGVRELEHSAV